jgi:GH24 family phage-related lysozyme (muramidase)
MENESLSLQSLYDVRSFIMSSEGFSAKAYRDTKGLLTIGYGFNLQQSSARSIMASFGLDYNAYVNGKLMDRATAEKLFDYHYNSKVA